jgi:hypothetical protein
MAKTPLSDLEQYAVTNVCQDFLQHWAYRVATGMTRRQAGADAPGR